MCTANITPTRIRTPHAQIRVRARLSMYVNPPHKWPLTVHICNTREHIDFRIGLLASHCFEECELTLPWIFFTNRGAQVVACVVFEADVHCLRRMRCGSVLSETSCSCNRAWVMYDVVCCTGHYWAILGPRCHCCL